MFKIGQKVVSICNHIEIVKGKIYIVSNFYTCSCGMEAMSVEGVYALLDSYPSGTTCPCGKVEYGVRKFKPNRFRPIDETFTHETIAMLNEHFETLTVTV